MKKFEIEITKTTTIEVEIDETIINEKWIKDFSEVIYEVKDLKNLAECVGMEYFEEESTYLENFGEVSLKLENGTFLSENKSSGISIIEIADECESKAKEII